MKCLRKFEWVKLPREEIPALKGRMGYWLRLASRAAFRKGTSRYCGYDNAVEPGMWVGGIVGLKSILGVRSRRKVLQIMDELQELGYISYTLESDTKILTYRITDWVIKCSGAECQDGVVYTTPSYGFLCMPRDITQRLAEKGCKFDDADAWLDLWCHTVFQDYGNAFSFLAPAVQYGKYGSVLTLETLGKRWGWEKTKVWRFFHKLEGCFPIYRLPGSFGCVIFNMFYPANVDFDMPDDADVIRILELIRISARNTHTEGTDNERINRFVAWKSRRVMLKLREESAQNEFGERLHFENESDGGVSLSDHYNARVNFSRWNCKHSMNCIYDCAVGFIGKTENLKTSEIGAVCPFEEINPFSLPNPFLNTWRTEDNGKIVFFDASG